MAKKTVKIPQGRTSGKSQANIVTARLNTTFRYDTGQPRGGMAGAHRPVNMTKPKRK